LREFVGSLPDQLSTDLEFLQLAQRPAESSPRRSPSELDELPPEKKAKLRRKSESDSAIFVSSPFPSESHSIGLSPRAATAARLEKTGARPCACACYYLMV
jgi:hypothetical protein